MPTVSELMSQNIGNTITNSQTWNGVIYNVKAYGAKGDGSTDDASKIADAIVAASVNGGIVYFPPGTYVVGSALTFPSNVTAEFSNGAKLSINSGITVTINGPVNAGLYQIFSGFGTIAGTPKVDAFYPQWWGAKGDGINDDTIAIQSAINITPTLGAIIYLPTGEYKVSAALTITNKSISLVGDGKDITRLVWNGGTDGIVYTSDAINRYFNISKLSVLTKGSGTYTAIKATWPSVASSTFPTASIEHVQIEGYDMRTNITGSTTTQYWLDGILITNGWHSKISNCMIRGTFNQTFMDSGIKFAGKTIDARISHCTVYFADNAFNITGASEGSVIAESSGIWVDRGVNLDGTGAGYTPPGCMVNNCHFSAFEYGVIVSTWSQTLITDNLIYRNANTGFKNFVAIFINDVGNSHTVSNNIIIGNVTVDTNCNGIVSNANYTTITGNSMVLVYTGIWIQTLSDKSTITGNSVLNFVGPSAILDEGTATVLSGNIPTTNTSSIRAYQSTPQSIAAATPTKVAFQTEEFDNNGEYDPVLSRFTAKYAGYYIVSSAVAWGIQTAGNRTLLTIYKNGATNTRLYDGSVGAATNSTSSGTASIKLAVGDYIEIYCYTSNALNTIEGTLTTYITITKVP